MEFVGQFFIGVPVSHNTKYVDSWDYKQARQKHDDHPIVIAAKNHTLPPSWNATGRLLWDMEQDKSTHLPQFVDKALKLLNLKQVAFEIENSVMSKVSCTACKAGNI